MKKHKKIAKTAALFFVGLLLFSGCGEKPSSSSDPEGQAAEQTSEPSTPQETEPSTGASVSGKAAGMEPAPASMRRGPGEVPDYGMPEEGAMRAMTLADAQGNLYYVDVNVGTFFTAPIPEDLTDAEGNPLTPDAIKAGCVVDIYGNGMMLESYPGQYPGTSKMVLVKEGTAEDAAPWQYLVDEISMPADPSEPPYMNAEYRTDLAAVSMVLTRGGYGWSYVDENGKTQHTLADSSHILAWPELNDIRIDESIAHGLPLHLVSSYKPQSVTVTRFPLDAWHKDASAEAELLPGENVEVQDTDEGYTITAEAGYVYLVEAAWEEGNAEFGFYTK